MNLVRASAFDALWAGLSVVPVALDGSKRPAGNWKQFMQRTPTSEEVDRWFASSDQTGMGFVCGAVSGGLEALDFDDGDAWTAFGALIKDHGLEELWKRVTNGYLERTPTGGYHVLWQTEALEANQKLACRRVADKIEVLIETRGEGGFIVVAPSCGQVHPSGRSYDLICGGTSTIVTISADEREAICAVARLLDQRERKVVAAKPSPAKGDRPGDRYNAETTWDNLLPHYGWTVAFTREEVTYWRRPDKFIGTSASTNWSGSDLLHVFTTSTILESDRAYDRFAFYTLMEHEGDFSSAARALAKGRAADQEQRWDVAEQPPRASGGKSNQSSMVIRPMSSVQPKEVDWIWPGWLAKGKFHLLGGMAGDGKSTIAACLAAIGSTGAKWPDGTQSSRIRTLFFLGEDAVDDTLRPRLDLHGANVDEIHFIETVLDGSGHEHFFNVAKHLPQLEDAVQEHQIDLLIIDPLTTIMPGNDRNAEGGVRDALSPLTKLAERNNLAIMGIVHVGKPNGTERSAAQKILGATAFTALARVVWMTASAGDDTMALGVVKANLTKKPQPLCWSRPEDGPIVWHGPSDRTIDDLMNGGPPRPGVASEEFLVEMLGDGPRPAREILAAAKEADIAKRTLDRAKDGLGVLSHKEAKKNGGWIWELPTASS